jgi:hypothetical protein
VPIEQAAASSGPDWFSIAIGSLGLLAVVLLVLLTCTTATTCSHATSRCLPPPATNPSLMLAALAIRLADHLRP